MMFAFILSTSMVSAICNSSLLQTEVLNIKTIQPSTLRMGYVEEVIEQNDVCWLSHTITSHDARFVD